MEELYKAKQDFLTNCYARDAIDPYMVKLLAEHRAYDKEFSILLLDIDHFKPFNDKHGHLDGDEVLKYFASSLRLGLAQIDSNIFRFGGDEFIVVFPEKSAREALAIATTLQDTFKDRPFLLGGKLLKMSFSGGIATCATDGDSPDKLVACADKAMYFSKRRGRARTTIYSRMWIERARSIGVLLASAIAMILGVLLLSVFFDPGMLKSLPPIKLPDTLKAPILPISGSSKMAIIRLKSGSVIKGRIIKERPDEIEISLTLKKGEGSVTIKRSRILTIERN